MFMCCTLGSDTFDFADTAITKFADYVQPGRAIEVPNFGVELQREDNHHYVNIPKLKFQFSEKIEIFKKLFEATEDTGFDTLFGLSRFLDLNTLTGGIRHWNQNISLALRDLLSTFVGQIVEENSEFISNMTSISSIGDGFNITDMTQEPKQKLNECIDNTSGDDKDKCQNILNLVIEIEQMFDETEGSEGDIIRKLIETKDNLMSTIVYKLNKTGFPVEVYDPILNETLYDISGYLFNKLIEAVNLIPNILDSIHVNLFTGPIATFYNFIFYDFGTIAAYRSLSFHLLLIGYLLVGLALKMRIPHLAPDDKNADGGNEFDDYSSDLEDFPNRGNNKVTSRRNTKSRLVNSSSSDSAEIRRSKRQTNVNSRRKLNNSDSPSSNSETSTSKQKKMSRKNSRQSTMNNERNNSFWLHYE